MDTGIKVGDIMTRDFIFASPESSLRECAKRMIQQKVGSLVIQDKGKLFGVLTERDIVYAFTKKPKELDKIQAKSLARKKVVKIKPSADLDEALKKMKKTKYRWLPVAVNNKVLGFLTLKDILRIEPNLFEAVREIMQIREEQQKYKRLKKLGKRIFIKSGLCEECGSYGALFQSDGKLLCENC
ncbi:CBS domain-containing protein [Candidatus Pacearchaeota archaeon]|nr:CBS domain-containing protein [Candidatus Pacearchaeota archaeon]